MSIKPTLQELARVKIVNGKAQPVATKKKVKQTKLADSDLIDPQGKIGIERAANLIGRKGLGEKIGTTVNVVHNVLNGGPCRKAYSLAARYIVESAAAKSGNKSAQHIAIITIDSVNAKDLEEAVVNAGGTYKKITFEQLAGV